MTCIRYLLLLAMLVLPVAARALDVPLYNPQHKEVTDLTGTLKPQEVDALVSKIRLLQSSDGTQVAVLLIPTLNGDDLFEFAQRVGTTWNVGVSKTDNGVLFIVVKNDKKVRIHVGYGLEGRLTDALSKRIILNEVQPEFRAGHYYQGIDRAVTAIVQAVKGEYKAAPVKASGNHPEAGFWIMILMLAFFWIMSVRASRSGRRRGHGGVFIWPGFGGGGGWSSGGGSDTGSSGGGWSSGGDSGGSFGGGDFGGGGASGDW